MDEPKVYKGRRKRSHLQKPKPVPPPPVVEQVVDPRLSNENADAQLELLPLRPKPQTQMWMISLKPRRYVMDGYHESFVLAESALEAQKRINQSEWRICSVSPVDLDAKLARDEKHRR